MPQSVLSYVAGGCGDEHTQDFNVAAFDRWGLIPRMMVDCSKRDLSVDLFGMRLPSPIFMAPIGVLGICAQDGHGDLAAAKAAAMTGVPMVASTLSNDPLEAVGQGDRRRDGFLSALHAERPRARRKLRASRRGGGVQGDRGDARHLGARLAAARSQRRQFPAIARPRARQLLQRSALSRAAGASRPEDARAAAIDLGAHVRQAADLGRPAVAALADQAAADPEGHLPSRRRAPRDRRRRRLRSIAPTTAGGRPMAASAAIDLLPAVVAACGKTPVLFDSGIRSGTDIVKALALGARAVGIGRPYAYGLALDGLVTTHRRYRITACRPASPDDTRPGQPDRRHPPDRLPLRAKRAGRRRGDHRLPRLAGLHIRRRAQHRHLPIDTSENPAISPIVVLSEREQDPALGDRCFRGVGEAPDFSIKVDRPIEHYRILGGRTVGPTRPYGPQPREWEAAGREFPVRS